MALKKTSTPTETKAHEYPKISAIIDIEKDWDLEVLKHDVTPKGVYWANCKLSKENSFYFLAAFGEIAEMLINGQMVTAKIEVAFQRSFNKKFNSYENVLVITNWV